ncbi:MAG: glycosyltransferase, partial [Deltaproteobacteria bacterium]|nr:glycosyltransferase [Deltaproteobacteria bacterium]
ERLVTELRKKRKNVHWIAEMVPKDAAIQLYSHADVFCCPSIYEPFGIINLEAMACETPVVGSAVGGIKEIVIPEETGLLVAFDQQPEAPFEPVDPEGFAQDLAAALNDLMADGDRRLAMAKAGRKRAEDHYAWRRVAEETVALYRRLLKA